MDKTSDPATGKVTEGEKHVIYVYERNQEKGTVIVHFVDEDGNKISDDVVNKKDVPTGEAYTTTPKDIPGYELDKTKIPSNKDGVVVKGTTEVTYVYHKTPEPKPTPEPDKPVTPTPTKTPKHKKRTPKKNHSWSSNHNPNGESLDHNKKRDYSFNYVPKGEDYNHNIGPKGQNIPTNQSLTSSKADHNSASTNTLPETGEKKSNLGVIGLSLAAVAGLMGLAIKKRKD